MGHGRKNSPLMPHTSSLMPAREARPEIVSPLRPVSTGRLCIVAEPHAAFLSPNEPEELLTVKRLLIAATVFAAAAASAQQQQQQQPAQTTEIPKLTESID